MGVTTESSVLKFTLKELDSLVKDSDSQVYLKKDVKYPLKLTPACLNNVNEAIIEILSAERLKYIPKYKGLLLAYKHVRRHSNMGTINDDECNILIHIHVDLYIFAPEIGCTMTGIATKVSEDNVACLVHKGFNVTLPRPRNKTKWIGSAVKLGDQVTFKLDTFNVVGTLPYIRGTLLSHKAVKRESGDVDFSQEWELPVANKKTVFPDSDEELPSTAQAKKEKPESTKTDNAAVKKKTKRKIDAETEDSPKKKKSESAPYQSSLLQYLMSDDEGDAAKNAPQAAVPVVRKEKRKKSKSPIKQLSAVEPLDVSVEALMQNAMKDFGVRKKKSKVKSDKDDDFDDAEVKESPAKKLKTPKTAEVKTAKGKKTAASTLSSLLDSDEGSFVLATENLKGLKKGAKPLGAEALQTASTSDKNSVITNAKTSKSKTTRKKETNQMSPPDNAEILQTATTAVPAKIKKAFVQSPIVNLPNGKVDKPKKTPKKSKASAAAETLLPQVDRDILPSSSKKTSSVKKLQKSAESKSDLMAALLDVEKSKQLEEEAPTVKSSPKKKLQKSAGSKSDLMAALLDVEKSKQFEEEAPTVKSSPKKKLKKSVESKSDLMATLLDVEKSKQIEEEPLTGKSSPKKKVKKLAERKRDLMAALLDVNKSKQLEQEPSTLKSSAKKKSKKTAEKKGDLMAELLDVEKSKQLEEKPLTGKSSPKKKLKKSAESKSDLMAELLDVEKLKQLEDEPSTQKNSAKKKLKKTAEKTGDLKSKQFEQGEPSTAKTSPSKKLKKLAEKKSDLLAELLAVEKSKQSELEESSTLKKTTKKKSKKQ